MQRSTAMIAISILSAPALVDGARAVFEETTDVFGSAALGGGRVWSVASCPEGLTSVQDCQQLLGGSQGDVYRATSTSHKGEVIIKDVTTTLNELQVMQALEKAKFPDMPRLYDVSNITEQNGTKRTWIVMELLSRPWMSLEDYLVLVTDIGKQPVLKGSLLFDAAMRRFQALVRATQRLHTLGWHHCDMHSANVFVNADNVDEVKFIDFGFTRPLDDGSSECDGSEADSVSLKKTLFLPLWDGLADAAGVSRELIPDKLERGTVNNNKPIDELIKTAGSWMTPYMAAFRFPAVLRPMVFPLVGDHVSKADQHERALGAIAGFLTKPEGTAMYEAFKAGDRKYGLRDMYLRDRDLDLDGLLEYLGKIVRMS